jgi:hypothetical protein
MFIEILNEFRTKQVFNKIILFSTSTNTAVTSPDKTVK